MDPIKPITIDQRKKLGKPSQDLGSARPYPPESWDYSRTESDYIQYPQITGMYNYLDRYYPNELDQYNQYANQFKEGNMHINQLKQLQNEHANIRKGTIKDELLRKYPTDQWDYDPDDAANWVYDRWHNKLNIDAKLKKWADERNKTTQNVVSGVQGVM